MIRGTLASFSRFRELAAPILSTAFSVDLSSALSAASTASSSYSTSSGSQHASDHQTSRPAPSSQQYQVRSLTMPQQISAQSTTGIRAYASSAPKQLPTGNFFVDLGNLKDNPKATKERIRKGRGESSNRGSYGGRGMKGQKARGRGPHLLYDGGQLGFLKYPIVRSRPSYQALYNQLGLSRVVEYVQLGLLDTSRVITMKDLIDTGCLRGKIKYGVMLYGKVNYLSFPLHIQVTASDEDAMSCTDQAGGSVTRVYYTDIHNAACRSLQVTASDEDAMSCIDQAGGSVTASDEDAMSCINQAGGSVTRVYYTDEGLDGLLNPHIYRRKGLPLPLPAHSWHPKHNAKFDEIGQLPPKTEIPALAQ
eukprot:gene7218-325_t